MKAFSRFFVLLTVAVGSVAAQEVLHAVKIVPNEEDQTLVPLVNRGGWVNPEDLIPMPQCIAQQDQSSWLSVMTKCTSKRCTRHFGVICTHHQWLTQLSCLSTEFSSDIVAAYLPYCSRSVLAKAQLYQWIHTVTGRTWLVNVGDANGLQTLSPASLARGYAAMDVINKAPTCLTNSASASSMEPFQHIMASCGFTSHTQHTGNAARPWEYRESLRSVIPLDFETVGFDITRHYIRYGDYFDQKCFCDAFGSVLKTEPCLGPGLASTMERMWLYVTCGSTSLPDNWTDGLQTTTYAYIPTERWRWPDCVTSMPKYVIGLANRCTTDACEADSNGYCSVKRAIDRACFCRNISYNTCKGPCHIFEARMDYVKWLHDLCGSEPGWHGLPKHWRQLTAITPLDMIPWSWNIKSSKKSSPTSVNRSKSSKSTHTCASTEWKLGSLILINIATLLAGFLGPRTTTNSIARTCLYYMHSQSWFLTGFSIAALHIFANWLNAVLIQSTLGYEEVPIIQLVLLWCSMPRFTWLTVLLIVFQPFQATKFSTAASYLFAEMILQTLSAYHIITAVQYGQEHSFYSNGMERLETAISAQYLYAGALMWLVTIMVALFLLTQAMYGANISTRGAGIDGLLSNSREERTYGTLPFKVPNNRIIKTGMARLFSIAIPSMILLWVAQWLFWAGFIGLSMEEFCPPKLGALTVIWMISSLAVAALAAFP